MLYIIIYEAKICFNNILSNNCLNFYLNASNRGMIASTCEAGVHKTLNRRKIMYTGRIFVWLFYIWYTIQSGSARFIMESKQKSIYYILAARNNIHWINVGFYDCDRMRELKENSLHGVRRRVCTPLRTAWPNRLLFLF